MSIAFRPPAAPGPASRAHLDADAGSAAQCAGPRPTRFAADGLGDAGGGRHLVPQEGFGGGASCPPSGSMPRPPLLGDRGAAPSPALLRRARRRRCVQFVLACSLACISSSSQGRGTLQRLLGIKLRAPIPVRTPHHQLPRLARLVHVSGATYQSATSRAQAGSRPAQREPGTALESVAAPLAQARPRPSRERLKRSRPRPAWPARRAPSGTAASPARRGSASPRPGGGPGPTAAPPPPPARCSVGAAHVPVLPHGARPRPLPPARATHQEAPEAPCSFSPTTCR